MGLELRGRVDDQQGSRASIFCDSGFGLVLGQPYVAQVTVQLTTA